jgi:hypothetical protein
LVCRLETWKAWHDAKQPHDSGVSAEWYVDRNKSAGQNQPGLVHQPIGLNVILTLLSEDIGTLSTSCCFRNSRGEFVVAQTQWRVIKMSVMEGEATALNDTIIMASSFGFDRVVFESDSQVVVYSIYSNSSGV